MGATTHDRQHMYQVRQKDVKMQNFIVLYVCRTLLQQARSIIAARARTEM